MNTRQQVTVTAVITAAIVAAFALSAGSRSAAPPAKPAVDAAAVRKARVARGEYLVTIGGCNDCHTPMKEGPNGPEWDMSRMLSGHPEQVEMLPVPKPAGGNWAWNGAITNTAFSGPWGVSYARNLTPEKLTGIGIWDEAMFIKTIRSGRHWGVGRPILPPMPWFNYAKMTDEDLKSVYAYLRSIPPVKNQVPDAIVAPPPQVASK